MSDVNAVVESSTTEAVTQNFAPETFTAAQHTEWMKTGNVPDVKPAAEPSPAAKEAVPAESTTASQQEKGRGADARKEQLNAEIRELLAKRDTLKAEVSRPDVKASSPKKHEPAPEPEFGEAGHEDETFGQFKAREVAHIAKEAVQAALSEDRAAREKDRVEADTAAAKKAVEDDWKERVSAAVAELKVSAEEFAEIAYSKDVPISDVMEGFILDSDIGPKVLHYLGKHIDEAKAIKKMPAYRAAKALHLIEQSIATGALAPAPEKKAPVIPFTKAAWPATDLKAVNSAPVDERRAAIEAGDMKRFNEIEDAKLRARKRG